MTTIDPSLVPADIVDADAAYTLDELCLSFQIEEKWVVGLVDHGAIEPDGQTKDDWRFTYVSIVRVVKARRLERDLELNLPGIALALELLDEIEALRLRLKAAQGCS